MYTDRSIFYTTMWLWIMYACQMHLNCLIMSLPELIFGSFLDFVRVWYELEYTVWIAWRSWWNVQALAPIEQQSLKKHHSRQK